MKPAGSNDLGAERSYASAEEALRDPEIEVADLCLPHRWHAPIAVARASKHVFVEKPIADTLEEADQMIAAYESIRQGRAMRLPLVPAERRRAWRPTRPGRRPRGCGAHGSTTPSSTRCPIRPTA